MVWTRESRPCFKGITQQSMPTPANTAHSSQQGGRRPARPGVKVLLTFWTSVKAQPQKRTDSTALAISLTFIFLCAENVMIRDPKAEAHQKQSMLT